MGRVYVQRDKPEDTKKLIVIKYILNQQIKLSCVVQYKYDCSSRLVLKSFKFSVQITKKQLY